MLRKVVYRLPDSLQPQAQRLQSCIRYRREWQDSNLATGSSGATITLIPAPLESEEWLYISSLHADLARINKQTIGL